MALKNSVAWEDAAKSFTRRAVVMEVYGDTGTGRTSLALTAPGPVALIHAAEKVDGIVQRVSSEKKVRLLNFGGVFAGSPQAIAQQASAVVEKMKAAWTDAIGENGRPGWARTVILDTHTEAWEILRLARFGTLTPQGRTDNLYGPVNAEWRSVFKLARMQQKCNVIVIGQTREEWKDKVIGGKTVGTRTGRTVRAGQKEIPFMVDVVLRTGRSASGGFTATIEKGWFNAQSEGVELEDDSIDFATILGMITETDEDEWR